MYCPNCGKAEQEENTYCRQCGDYLPDLKDTGRKKPKTPEEQFRLSIVFNLLSALAGISMAIALFIVHMGKEDTHPLIYVAISLFTVISIWQTISLFNNLNLKKRFIRKKADDIPAQTELSSTETKELLPEADFSQVVPASVTENTTKSLKQKVESSSAQSQKQSD